MQQLKWIYKGIKEIHRIRPGLMGMTLIRSVTGSLFPFINIYMSSVILNAIVSRESIQVLTGYAILTIALNAACSLITAILNSAVNLRQADFSHLYERHLAQRPSIWILHIWKTPKYFKRSSIYRMCGI